MSDLPETMLRHRGIWLPPGESHLQAQIDVSPAFAGAGTYQLAKLQAAVALLPPGRRRTALDIGAHVGLWSRVLAHSFHRIECFEPVPGHRACWERNMAGLHNLRLHPYAASDRYGPVFLALQAGNSGNTRIVAEAVAGGILADGVPLDALALPDVDFIKADCEGWEEPALRGLAQTIERHRPVIVAEQKPGHAERAGLAPLGAVTFVCRAFGYRVASIMSGDYILVPPNLPAWDAAAPGP